VASKLSTRCRILYLQNEVSAEQFRGWFAQQRHDPRQIFVCENTGLDAHQRAIRQVRPSLIVVDSVSMLTTTGKQSRFSEIVQAYRRWAQQINAHVILIGHLNQQGQVKGGTTLGHLVDTVVHIHRSCIPDWVEFRIPSKHRFGPTGRTAVFLHRDWGLESVCVGDDRWPMGELRFQPDGRALRRVPMPGTGGQMMLVDEDGDPVPEPDRRSRLRRLLRLK
jgi:DNA repair protein RadA/Sms